MFKSTFTKYIVAFAVIILVSFLTLSGIITSMIRSYITEDKEKELSHTADLIVDHVEEKGTEDIKAYVNSGLLSEVVLSLVKLETSFNVFVADQNGMIIFSTVTADGDSSDGAKNPVINIKDGLGNLNLNKFDETKDENNTSTMVHRGDLDGILPDQSLAFLKNITTGGEVRGYVVTFVSTASEDNLVAVTRKAVINGSVWVMAVALIATYFITQRIVLPLKTMTGAAKKFAKGDFSGRVAVYGKDEVSELAVAFNNMAEALDSLEKMRNSFLANISHDLRTPMTTISGFIDGITSGAIPPEKHEYYLNVISAEVHRLSRLVGQILDVSRLESGERKFNFIDFDIAEMARIILISFEQKIDGKRLDVEFNAEFDEMYVNADKDAIYQVLYNLCHNAIKFAREGGKFSININFAEQKKIRVSVFDEGQSISSEDIRLVFDRFYKTDKSRGLDKNGVGLGLYISKTIIDAHGEKIWAESVDGESSEFIFTLKEGVQPQKKKPIDPDLLA